MQRLTEADLLDLKPGEVIFYPEGMFGQFTGEYRLFEVLSRADDGAERFVRVRRIVGELSGVDGRIYFGAVGSEGPFPPAYLVSVDDEMIADLQRYLERVGKS